MGANPDRQFKNDLRKELIFYDKILELLDENKPDELKKMVMIEKKRVEASLQG